MADILPVAQTNFRNRTVKFGIKREDRRRHIYIIGKTGSGKTTLINNMIVNDIRTNEGLAYIDPHGDSVFQLLNYIPRERMDDVIYFEPNDLDNPISFNVLERVPFEFRHLITSSLMSVFKKIWVDAWSARMEYILMNSLLALLEFPNYTLLDINRLLGDDDFRKSVVSRLRDPVVKSFWEKEFARYHANFRTEAIAPIQNKVGQFISNPLVRNIIGQEESSINLRQVMDNQKILLINLSKGALGEESSMLLGGLLITKIQLAAMSRVDLAEEERKDFYLYVDEFQNFATDSFVNILSEARKYRLSLILAHQYLDQLPETIIKAIFGNLGTFIVFRLGGIDSEQFEREFSEVTVDDFTNLEKYNIYVRLLVDGIASRPFLAETLAMPDSPSVSYRNELINLSRSRYSRAKRFVEKAIAQKYSEARKENMILVYCENCHEAFWKNRYDEGSLCPNCEAQSSKNTISLESLKEKKLEAGFKPKAEKQNRVEVDRLEELFKKFQNEN
ncbi:MAG: type IV secretion system DNA-binding domain-containing protein [Patescibacteria group bacterium]|nr:type IV secretion system DNA-binding domain-containing protein [Patescibacteria group bacterium]MCL5257827.1 type IV secretion system DNA-binding domain-containing protein [Patescibacteria group bacterium]